jgi:hypothetical protein
MHIEQEIWSRDGQSQKTNGRGHCGAPQLVMAFAAPELLRASETWQKLRARWPGAALVAGSTAGEICGTRVLDDTLVATAIEFEKTEVRCAAIRLAEGDPSDAVGRQLADRLLGDGLRHVFVLSDGLKVNGSALVRGLTERLPGGVSLTGGLCGDGSRFESTHACLDESSAGANVVGIGFYGKSLKVGVGSLGGWDPFGPERRITRSEGNVLFELDGQPALALYERYLAEHAAGLPASGLLFPLTVRAERDDLGVVRTILAVDRERGSLTFAGDVPQGHFARLMRANFDRLVDGASGAARTSHDALGGRAAELAILISCVGRKLVLKQRVEEEVEGAQRVLGSGVVMTGFYSYGEISPFTPGARCELHNQTMSITTLAEN